MNSNEYWLNDTTFINESENGNIGITFYYGNSRQYAIKGVTKNIPDKEKNIKQLIKEIKAAKKNTTPLHGCTYYL